MRVVLSLPERDAVVRCEPDDPVGAITEAALGSGAPALFLDSRPLDPREPAAVLTDGATLSPGRPHLAGTNPAPGSLVAQVVTGPAAGTVVALAPGRTTVGRVPPFGLADPDVSREHLHLDLDERGTVTAVDAGSTNGSSLDGVPLTSPAPVPLGAVLWVGGSALTVRAVPRPDAAVRPDGEGGLLYNRPPRLAPPRRTRRIAVPTPPAAPDKRDWPVVMVIAPLAIGVVMAFVTKQPMFLLFVLLSPVMLLSTAITERRRGAKGHRAALRTYREEKERAEADLAAALAEEVEHRRRDAPDAAELLVAARSPASSIWHRHRADADFLDLRLGLGDVPPDTEVKSGVDVERADTQLFSVPISIRLPDVGALGLAGPSATVLRLARWCVAQAALLHSPQELQICLLTTPAAQSTWHWVRWLPHLRIPDGGSWARVGNDEETARSRIAELTDLVERRRELVRGLSAGAVLDRLPAVLVVLDGARTLRNLAGMGPLLQDGPALGVHFLCLDEAEAMLPRECGAVALLDRDRPGHLVLRTRGDDDGREAVTDQVGARWAETVGRALAPLRDADPTLAEGALPTEARFTRLAGLSPARPEELLRRWSAIPRSTVALLGASTEGDFRLDMADGPHALIAGTTGAGKSGLLQTLVAALAVANRPDAMNFLLVDYKGGAAFRDCARLPHCVGVVTDLDAGATSRALTSLRAELKRREHVLDRAGSADIAAYWSTRQPTADPLPRLVIVIDEFAQLVTEMPDFVAGLVDVAARGRSLGIHLVLATQQPQGVVNTQIRSNTTIRISLRVADETSSTDIIGIPDAGRLPRIPGRAFVKVGAEAPVAIQTARTDTAGPGAQARRRRPTATTLRWEWLGHAVAEPPEPPPPPGQRTDLSEIVDAVTEATRRLGIPPQRSPWQPPLPVHVRAEALRATGLVVPFGLEDVPETQRQFPAVLDLPSGSHLAVVGAPRSGRSTALRTLGAGLAGRLSPDDVHLYAIDGAGSAMRGLAALPHCGAVVGVGESDRVARLVTRLLDEVGRRQRLFATAGVSDLAEYRDLGEVLPYLVLLVDGYEGVTGAFSDVDGGRVVSDLQRLLRDGVAAGVRAVVAGDRSVLVGAAGSLLGERLVLRLANDTDYGYAGISAREVPDDLPVGRATRAGTGTQVQIAVLGDDPSGRAQATAVAALASRCRPGRTRPFGIDVLPETITRVEAGGLPRGAGLLVGVGGDDLSGITWDPTTDGNAVLVHGPRRSGRTTALVSVALDARAQGWRVVGWTPRPSALGEVAGDLSGTEATEEELAAALAHGPALLLVDDVETVAATSAGRALGRLIAGGEQAVVVAGLTESVSSAMSGPALEAGRGGIGLLLCPNQPIAGAVFSAAPRIPRSLIGTSTPGRGLFLRAGELTPVQVPS
ncbi:FtsK/SpoIIIE domain-containing protein [Actinomycetospora sp. OC33-EN08]|uniref:FtsK/SpoIIIE domain-containing protein n=1 Tax=Actinomycetospora aurantiaca TaxID=3129233 RepID=A0ABU8MHH5_9PSEU